MGAVPSDVNALASLQPVELRSQGAIAIEATCGPAGPVLFAGSSIV